MLPIRQWFDINKGEHDADWANRIIRWIRIQMQPLVNIENARIGMDYLLGRQDMSAIENLFANPANINLNNRPVSPIIARGFLDDPDGKKANTGSLALQEEMIGVEFKSLPVWEKPRNVLLAEIKKMGVVVNVKASDPTSTVARQTDEHLIRHRKEIEGFLSYIYTSIGQKPVTLPEYKNRFGEKHDNGNTQDFDKMGLNPDNPDDVNFFMNYFHKLGWEISMQKVIDAIIEYNEVQSEKFDKWGNDILSKKAIAAQQYVSNETGGIVYDYITPETVYIYGGGRRKDYNDANAKAYQQLITIKEFLDRVGSSFDYESHIDKIILSVFTASNGAIDITGINPDYAGYGNNSEVYCRGRNNVTYSHNQFMQFKVLFGYMEWISQEETDYGAQLKGKKFDNAKAKNKPGRKAKRQELEAEDTAFENNQNPDGKKYQTKARYETPTYKAYYLAITSIEHIMFDFGKVTYQDIEGYNDFSTNFSIITYKEIGDPLAVIGIPMIDLINETWYKWKYEIRRAKPRGTNYNYDSIMSIAQDLFSDTEMSEGEKFSKIISWRDRSANGVWKFPIGPDGKPLMMTAAQLDQDLPNGLTNEVMKYWEILASTWDKFTDMTMGKADLRQGDSAGDRSSMNNEFKALEYSQNSTYYLPDMITYMCRAMAVRTSMIVQDIVQFKDYDTLAYKFLENMIGDEALDDIESMGKTAMHRYGIFVESLNQSAKMVKLSNRLDFALQNGKISNAEALLVEEIKSPTLAYQTLAYYEQRTARIAQENALQQQKAVADQAMQIEQMKQKTETIKGDYMVQVATIQASANTQGHIINQEGGIAKTAIKGNIDSQLIVQQATADLKAQQQSLNDSGRTTPPPPPIAQQQTSTQGPAPQSSGSESGVKELIDRTTPGANVVQ